jgi:1,4-alpha-glucan branching enzyme
VEKNIALLMHAELGDPFALLGPHTVEAGDTRVVIRTMQPHAESVDVVIGDAVLRAERTHADGLFTALLPVGISALPGPDEYRLRIRGHDGNMVETPDPYAFPPVLTPFDLYLLAEGTHYQSYEKLGAHVRAFEGFPGVHVAVWAPNALRVSVVGDFNRWDGRVHPMRSRGGTGIWELFLPGLESGAIYKYEIRSKLGDLPFLKSDPYAFEAELRPKSGSVVASLGEYRWGDADWMHLRTQRDWLSQPISVYEVHLGSWRRVAGENNRWLTYRELADQMIPYVKQMGYTHIELMPVMEHPFDGSWGYQTVGYYAATRRFGTPADFMYFVDRCHQESIGVILDWTPAHFPADAHGLAEFDGTHLYEHADPRQGRQPDWGTLVFNYGRAEVRNFLISNALFWFSVYHVDGLRVDAVASMLYLDYSRHAGEWIPNEFGGRENLAAIAFLKHMNETVRTRCPGVLMIAEESSSWPAVSRPVSAGGLGFTLKWNMGWMNDTLRYFALDSVYRKYHHGELTFSMLYAFNENFVLPLSHDEVVHGKGSLLNKMPGDLWQQFANLRLLYAYMFAHPGKKLLFMGGELGQRAEWTHERELEWELLQYPEHRGLHRLVADLNALYQRERSLHEVDFAWQGFEWMECNDADAGILAFVRHANERAEALLIVASFTPATRENYRVGVPEPGRYQEIFNSDAEIYGGTNVGNFGGVTTEPVPWMGQPYSVLLRVPPLGAAFFKRQD